MTRRTCDRVVKAVFVAIWLVHIAAGVRAIQYVVKGRP